MCFLILWINTQVSNRPLLSLPYFEDSYKHDMNAITHVVVCDLASPEGISLAMAALEGFDVEEKPEYFRRVSFLSNSREESALGYLKSLYAASSSQPLSVRIHIDNFPSVANSLNTLSYYRLLGSLR